MNAPRLVSNLLHPGLAFPLVVALTAAKATSSVAEWVKWTVLTLFMAYLLPILYIGLRARLLGYAGGRWLLSRALFRERPVDLLLITFLFAVPVSLVLRWLHGPDAVLATLVAVAGAMAVVALVNLAYRASFHLALVTSLLSSLWLLFGLVSLLGLARYRLGEHTQGQLMAGFAIGLAITLAVFGGMGLLP